MGGRKAGDYNHETDTDGHLGNLTLDQNTETVLYIGLSAPGTLPSAAAWQIRRLTDTNGGNTSTIEWADGNTKADNVWDNRTGLSYA